MNLPTIVRNGFALVAVAAAIGLMVLAAGCGQSTPKEGGPEKPLLAGKPVELPAEEPEKPSPETLAGKSGPDEPLTAASACDRRQAAGLAGPTRQATKWMRPWQRRPPCCRRGHREPIRHRRPTRCDRKAVGWTRVGQRCNPSRRPRHRPRRHVKPQAGRLPRCRASVGSAARGEASPGDGAERRVWHGGIAEAGLRIDPPRAWPTGQIRWGKQGRRLRKTSRRLPPAGRVPAIAAPRRSIPSRRTGRFSKVGPSRPRWRW